MSMMVNKTRSFEDYTYKREILDLKDIVKNFLKEVDIGKDVVQRVKIKNDKSDICYHVHGKDDKITYYENGETEVNPIKDYDKEFDWYFLKFYDQSLNEDIDGSIKEKYSSIINHITKLPLTYGAFHHCSANTFIFEHYDQTTSPEKSETGRTNIIIPLSKPDSKGCIIHVDNESFDLMDYDAFCFNAQFKHKMYNNTGEDVVLLVLHSRSSDFEVAS
jgi:hypothetical protein